MEANFFHFFAIARRAQCAHSRAQCAHPRAPHYARAPALCARVRFFLDFFDFRRNFFSLKKFPEIPPQSPAGLNATRIFAPCYFLPEIAKNPVYFLSFWKKAEEFFSVAPNIFWPSIAFIFNRIKCVEPTMILAKKEKRLLIRPLCFRRPPSAIVAGLANAP